MATELWYKDQNLMNTADDATAIVYKDTTVGDELDSLNDTLTNIRKYEYIGESGVGQSKTLSIDISKYTEFQILVKENKQFLASAIYSREQIENYTCRASYRELSNVWDASVKYSNGNITLSAATYGNCVLYGIY